MRHKTRDPANVLTKRAINAKQATSIQIKMFYLAHSSISFDYLFGNKFLNKT